MEDVVAVEVMLASGEARYFMTWGRIQHVTDPAALESLVLQHASRFSLGDSPPVGARLCLLRDARDQPYFYEALLDFARRPAPSADEYDSWLATTAARMNDGKDLYFLGRPTSVSGTSP